MRKLIFLAALLLGGLPLPVLSQGAYPTKGKESKEGKIAALPTRGVLTFGGGARYEGDLVHGKAHGKGVITFPSGDRYEGEFVGNKYQGKGIYISPSGQRYEGDYVAGVRQGKGILTWPNGQRYEGDFMNGKRSGYGVMTLSDGTRYAGNWLAGVRQGKGISTSPSGQRYEGDYVADLRQGKGVLTWPSGERYEGDFMNNVRQGKGVLTWPSGQRYEGDFMNEKYSGYGVLTRSDGTRYAGNWLNDELVGKAQQTSQAGHAESRTVAENRARQGQAAGAGRQFTTSDSGGYGTNNQSRAELECRQRKENTVRRLRDRLLYVARECPDGGRDQRDGRPICGTRDGVSYDQRVAQAVFEAGEDLDKAELDDSCSRLAPGLEAYRERREAENALEAEQRRTERAERTERRLQRERDSIADSSTSNAQDTSIGAHILQRGAEMERMLGRVDRQTIAALDQVQRGREQAQAAARERSERAERDRARAHDDRAERDRSEALRRMDRQTQATVTESNRVRAEPAPTASSGTYNQTPPSSSIPPRRPVLDPIEPPRSTPMWTSIGETAFEGVGPTRAEGCDSAEKNVAKFSPTMADTKRKLISRKGGCSCSSVGGNPLAKPFYTCRIVYSMEITTSRNPNTRQTTSEGVSR